MEVLNKEVYTSGMRKSMLDKIFFMDKINSNKFVDFGCADGSMLFFLQKMFPEYLYIGYDNAPDMIKLAREKGAEVIFTEKWSKVTDLLDGDTVNTLILSSVIHEIYSYCNPEEVALFYEKIFNADFEYIVMRDMMLSSASNRKSNLNDVIKIYRNADETQLMDFENVWGSIDNNKNLIHYLLKYRYKENWKRESVENYLPLTYEKFLSIIPADYEVIFCEHYCLPFLRDIVKQDFNIDLIDNTHVKFILRRIK